MASRSPRDVIALTVLALLAEKPCHPYEMQRLIRVRHKDFALGRTRAFYHAVERLARDGFIEPVEVSREGRRPERTVYRITDDGREEYEGWLLDLLSMPVPEHPMLMVAVSFLGSLPPDKAAQALRERATVLEASLSALAGAMQSLSGHLPRLALLENELETELGQAELRWLRAVMADIESEKLDWAPASERRD